MYLHSSIQYTMSEIANFYSKIMIIFYARKNWYFNSISDLIWWTLVSEENFDALKVSKFRKQIMMFLILPVSWVCFVPVLKESGTSKFAFQDLLNFSLLKINGLKKQKSSS